MAPITDTKLMIASDGERTLVMLNGEVITCESMDFHAESHNVVLTIMGENLTRGRQSEAFFFDTLENMLGYKLRNQ